MTANNQIAEASVKYLAEAAGQIVPVGYKQTEVGVIPGDWGVVQITDVCDFIVPGRNKPALFDGRIPWITTPDFQDGGGVSSSRLGLCISREEAKKIGSKVVPAGSVIMSCVGDLGITGIANQEIVINQQLHAFIPSGKINAHFLLHVLKTKKDYFYSIATKTALPYLNKENCNSVKLPAPPIAEQTAIANALSDVDTLINELEKLIAKKQAIKTATMQQLLTGRTRLPQFALREDGTKKGYKQSELGEIPEDWDLLNLPKVIWYQEGPGLRNWQFKKKGLKVINVTNLQETGWLDLDRTDRHISWDECEKTYKHFLCDEGDLVLASSGNSYCKSSVVRGCDLPLLMNTSVIRFKPINDFSKIFMNVYLKSQYFKNQIDLLITGGAQPNFGPAHLDRIKILAPLLPEEQSIIATILSDMDTDIQTLQQRLSKTRQIKQGMMQELLTGRIRLVS